MHGPTSGLSPAGPFTGSAIQAARRRATRPPAGRYAAEALSPGAPRPSPGGPEAGAGQFVGQVVGVQVSVGAGGGLDRGVGEELARSEEHTSELQSRQY